jgi:chromosome partitioning protein
MDTTAVLNKKGGTGKTSTCHHLAGVLAARGLRVLLVDADAQANLTQGLLGPDVARDLDPAETLAALFGDSGAPPTRALVRPTPLAGISILPGSEAMDELDDSRPAATGVLQFALRDALADVQGDFDVCLVDCPPSAHLCSWAALVASLGVLIPIQTEDYGSQGLVAVKKTIRRVQAGPNPDLQLLGILPTMVNRKLSVHASYEADLRAIYGAEVFEAVMPLATDFKEAVMVRKPVNLTKPRSAAARAMVALADEFLARSEAIGGRTRRVA